MLKMLINPVEKFSSYIIDNLLANSVDTDLHLQLWSESGQKFAYTCEEHVYHGSLAFQWFLQLSVSLWWNDWNVHTTLSHTKKVWFNS